MTDQGPLVPLELRFSDIKGVVKALKALAKITRVFQGETSLEGRYLDVLAEGIAWQAKQVGPDPAAPDKDADGDTGPGTILPFRNGNMRPTDNE